MDAPIEEKIDGFKKVAILNRKAMFEKFKWTIYDAVNNGVAKRQNFLLSSRYCNKLSNEDLTRHRNQLRSRKILKWVTFLSIPAVLFYFRYSYHALAYSLIPSYIFAKFLAKQKLLYNNNTLSIEEGIKSQKYHYEMVLKANDKKISQPSELWNFEKPRIKEWLAREDYR
jgi:hypothetical protein